MLNRSKNMCRHLIEKSMIGVEKHLRKVIFYDEVMENNFSNAHRKKFIPFVYM